MRKSIATVGIFVSALASLAGVGAANAVADVTSPAGAPVYASAKTEWKCPRWHSLLRKYNLPVKTFDPIMYRESRCQEKVIGWNYRAGMSHMNCKRSPAETYKKCSAVSSYDSGLLQINSTWVTVTSQVCRSKWGDMTVLLNAECNIKVASYLFHKGGGIGNWKGTSGA